MIVDLFLFVLSSLTGILAIFFIVIAFRAWKRKTTDISKLGEDFDK